MKVVIVRAARTPISTFLGDLKDVSAVSLATIATKAVLRTLPAEDVADVILGSVLQAGQGMNPARQVALESGLQNTIPGQTINRVCGSGLQAIISAVQALRAGDGQLYLAGGAESMSRAPFLVQEMRSGRKFGDATLTDSMLSEGLTDPTHRYHMGITAEKVAERYRISREDQDRFALESHLKAAAAQTEGRFEREIVPVSVPTRKGMLVVSQDTGIRHDTSLDALARLKPAFEPNGTVTAGNASGLNDGAAMVAVCSEAYASVRGLAPLAEVLSYAVAGVDPEVMGVGPIPAIRLTLQRAGIGLDEVDHVELNEAFASQSLAVIRELGIPAARVNPNGGAIALGHPIGASGARIVVTLLHTMQARGSRIGLASLCIGGGMGIAMVFRAAPATGS